MARYLVPAFLVVDHADNPRDAEDRVGEWQDKILEAGDEIRLCQDDQLPVVRLATDDEEEGQEADDPSTMVGLVPIPEASNLERVLHDLVRLILDGRQYEPRNPYTRPEVEAALKVLSRVRNVECWLNAADTCFTQK